MTTARRPATPYARRLAGERGITLGDLPGSGPNGRITAADVLAFVPKPASLPAATAPAEAKAADVVSPSPRAVGAFQASLDLGPLGAFILASGSGLTAEPFLIKAAARGAGARGGSLLFRDAGGRAGLVEAAATLSPSEIAQRHAAGVDGDAPLVVECLRATGIRPLSSTLAADALLKLVIVLDADRAELLLVHDEAAIPATEAVAILAAIRDLAEMPLRLLV